MNYPAVMALYNQHERIDLEIPGFSKIVGPDLVKFVAPTQSGSCITYSHLSSAELDARIEAEIRYFQQLKRDVEWKTYNTDSPENLSERLVAHGFKAAESESFMVLPLARSSAELPEAVAQLVEVQDPPGIADAMAVQQAVWGGDVEAQLAQLVQIKAMAPESLQIYVIYEQGQPVSSAWIVYNHASPFAGIYGGSTLPKYRGRGHYSALLERRIHDATQRGKRYLTIDALPMSQKIVEKYGFQQIATTVPYTYHPDIPDL